MHVENDANLGALAEHRRGLGRGHDNLVFVKVSSGVGAGLIIRGEIFQGANGTAGRSATSPSTTRGRCADAGAEAASRRTPPPAPRWTMMGEQLPDARIDDIIEAAKQGNVSALRVFEDAGLHLGWGLGRRDQPGQPRRHPRRRRHVPRG